MSALPPSGRRGRVERNACGQCAREWVVVYGRSVYGAPCKDPTQHRDGWQTYGYLKASGVSASALSRGETDA